MRPRPDPTEIRIPLESGVELIVPHPLEQHHHEHRLQRLIGHLPAQARKATVWLRRPSSRWARLPAALLLSLGGLFSILPFLGLWMLPLGLMLLAEDSPLLWRARGRLLAWTARLRPHWFGA